MDEMVEAAAATWPGGIKSSLSVALMCTKRRRIPASAGTNQGPEKGDLILL